MNLKNIVLSFAVLIMSLAACTKDYTECGTSAAEVAKELQQTIGAKSITRIYPVQSNEPLPSSFSASSGTAWSFSNGFISINFGFNLVYNLAHLQYYEVANVSLDDGSTQTALLLFF